MMSMLTTPAFPPVKRGTTPHYKHPAVSVAEIKSSINKSRGEGRVGEGGWYGEQTKKNTVMKMSALSRGEIYLCEATRTPSVARLSVKIKQFATASLHRRKGS